MFGIWDFDNKDWIREPESNGVAILVFEKKDDAFKRAAKYYGFSNYKEAKEAGWCEVKEIPH